jgi:hypothetical protein
MRTVGGVVAAALLAAEFLLRFADARAGELANLYPELITLDSPASELDLPATEIGNLHHLNRYLLFAGFDLWRNGGFAHGGLLWSPGGIEREGLTFKLLLAGGLYRYHATSRSSSPCSLVPICKPTCLRLTIATTRCGVLTSAFASAPISGTSRGRDS